jgi:uncharacterized membrane protein YcaP (DUF421 family)
LFFDGWSGLARVVLVGVPAYVALVFLLRISGKRTLTKMNAFDLVITVALGSTFATVLLSSSVALAEGVLAFALLIALQFAVTWLSVRSKGIRDLVKAEPRLLFHDGAFLPGAMRSERVTEEEVRAGVRQQGIVRMGSVEAVVLETDGTLTVLRSDVDGQASSLAGVKGRGSQEG